MMNTNITINTKEFLEISGFMSKGIKEPAKNVVKRISGFAENRMGLNATKFVYSIPPKTNSYKRKGRLLGGRGTALSGGLPAKTLISPLEIKLEANSKLKGAKVNYSPAVNDGVNGTFNVKSFTRRGRNGAVVVRAHKRTMNVPAKPFFDTSVKETQDKATSLAREALDAYFIKNNFK